MGKNIVFLDENEIDNRIQTAIKNANTAEDKEAAVKVAIKKVDKAAAKGLLHKNTAARKKSALAKSLNK